MDGRLGVLGEIPSFKLFESERVFAFLDIQPLSRGHAVWEKRSFLLLSSILSCGDGFMVLVIWISCFCFPGLSYWFLLSSFSETKGRVREKEKYKGVDRDYLFILQSSHKSVVLVSSLERRKKGEILLLLNLLFLIITFFFSKGGGVEMLHQINSMLTQGVHSSWGCTNSW